MAWSTAGMKTRNLPRTLYAWDLARKLSPGTDGPLVVSADGLILANPALRIEGAVSPQEFKAMRDSIPKDREIIFYSNTLEDSSAMERALEYEDSGFSRVAILKGGMNAWIAIVPFLAARRTPSPSPV